MKVFEYPGQREQIRKMFLKTTEPPREVVEAVTRIISGVRRRGDDGVAHFTKLFDKVNLEPPQFEVSAAELDAAVEALEPELRKALELAARRIRAFHKKQCLTGWTMNEQGFGRMEMRVQPLERVGVYAPGGKAAYPSTVLMDIIPAKVAGVEEVVLVTPPAREGHDAAATLAAARIAGVDRVFRVGGAQAIAALAYGTGTIPCVDKIVGPGNIYVATAKQLLFGVVDIDMIAGPTEVVVIADETARTEWIAADLLAQAEHDEDAQAVAILIGWSEEAVEGLLNELALRLKGMERREIAAASMKNNGAIVLVGNVEDALALTNEKAPEHVEVLTRNAAAVAKKIRHAGAIFIGPYTPEPVGDYIAGPNHTLPTGGTARFFSPLSVWSFYKTSHTIEATAAGLRKLAPSIETLAEAEGLTGHARSVRSRAEFEAPKGASAGKGKAESGSKKTAGAKSEKKSGGGAEKKTIVRRRGKAGRPNPKQ